MRRPTARTDGAVDGAAVEGAVLAPPPPHAATMMARPANRAKPRRFCMSPPPSGRPSLAGRRAAREPGRPTPRSAPMAHRTAWPTSWAYSADAESPRDRRARCGTSRSAIRTRSGRRCCPSERFPDQLVAALGESEPSAPAGGQPRASTGTRARDLIREELPAVDGLDAGLRDAAHRRQRRRAGRAAHDVRGQRRDDPRRARWPRLPARSGSSRSRSRTTPSPRPARDYGDPATASAAAIVAANVTMARLSAARSIRFVDIFDLSRRAADGSGAGRLRWAAPIGRPVRPLGRADPAGRRGAARRLSVAAA